MGSARSNRYGSDQVGGARTEGMAVWDGNCYAFAVPEPLGLAGKSGTPHIDQETHPDRTASAQEQGTGCLSCLGCSENGNSRGLMWGMGLKEAHVFGQADRSALGDLSLHVRDKRAHLFIVELVPCPGVGDQRRGLCNQ